MYSQVATYLLGRDKKCNKERRQLRSQHIIKVAMRNGWLDQLTRSLIRKKDVATKKYKLKTPMRSRHGFHVTTLK